MKEILLILFGLYIIKRKGKDMDDLNLKTIIILSILLAVTLALVSIFGAFVPGTYERETPSMAAQGTGQDLVDLFFILPLFLISLIYMLKDKKTAYFIYSGTVLYILYSFIIYSFGVHFNQLFLLYCFTLGLSLYAFILIMCKLNNMDVNNWFSPKIPARSLGIYLIVIAVLFYLLWFKDVIPAILHNTVPKSVSNYNLLVNPVHVIDIAFALPGLIITAILLFKKSKLGYILGPVSLVFVINLAIALTGMVIMVKIRGVSDDSSVAGIFIILAVISLIFLILFLRKLKTNKIK